MGYVYTYPTWVQNAALHNDWLMIQLLVAAGGVIKASADGIAAYSSSASVITSTTPWATGANCYGNAKAWVRVQMPDGFEYLFVAGSGGAVTLTRKVKISTTNPFTGGSPSATVAPSATGEVVIAGGGTDAAPTYAQASRTGYANWGRFLGVAQTTAPYGFWCANLGVGGQTVEHITFRDPLLGYGAGDTDPTIYRFAMSNVAAIGSWYDMDQTSCFSKYGAAYTGTPALAPGIINSSGVPTPFVPGPGGAFSALGANPANGLYYTPRIRWGRDYNRGAAYGHKGLSTFFRARTWGDAKSGKMASVDTRNDHVVVGDFLAYWPGAPLVGG